MLALGVILIVLAALVAVFVVLGSPDPLTCGAEGSCSTFELGGIQVTMDPLWVFLTGAGTVLLLVLGLELMRAAARRARRRRQEKKDRERRAERLESHEAMHSPEEGHTAPSTGRDDATGDTVTDRDQPRS